MRKLFRLLWALPLLLLFASGAFAQCPTQTPNVQFQVPNIGNTTTWGICLNGNLATLDNLLGGSAALPAGSATVAINQHTNWITANTGPITITNIVNGYSGQTIRIFCGTGDSFTTITSSATINLSSNWTCPSNALTLTLIGSVWQEASREISVGAGQVVVGTATGGIGSSPDFTVNSSTHAVAIIATGGANGALTITGGSTTLDLFSFTAGSVAIGKAGGSTIQIDGSGSVIALQTAVVQFGGPTFGNGTAKFQGSIGGSASIEVASNAGTPNPIVLPTTTGTAGAFLSTDGNNPQQASWFSLIVPTTLGSITPVAEDATQFCSPTTICAAGLGLWKFGALAFADLSCTTSSLCGIELTDGTGLAGHQTIMSPANLRLVNDSSVSNSCANLVADINQGGTGAHDGATEFCGATSGTMDIGVPDVVPTTPKFNFPVGTGAANTVIVSDGAGTGQTDSFWAFSGVVVGSDTQTAEQTGNYGPITLITSGSATGSYLITIYVEVSTSVATSTITTSISYHDDTGAQTQSGTSLSGATAGTIQTLSFPVRFVTGNALTYSTSTANSPKYKIIARAQFLG